MPVHSRTPSPREGTPPAQAPGAVPSSPPPLRPVKKPRKKSATPTSPKPPLPERFGNLDTPKEERDWDALVNMVWERIYNLEAYPYIYKDEEAWMKDVNALATYCKTHFIHENRFNWMTLQNRVEELLRDKEIRDTPVSFGPYPVLRDERHPHDLFSDANKRQANKMVKMAAAKKNELFDSFLGHGIRPNPTHIKDLQDLLDYVGHRFVHFQNDAMVVSEQLDDIAEVVNELKVEPFSSIRTSGTGSGVASSTPTSDTKKKSTPEKLRKSLSVDGNALPPAPFTKKTRDDILVALTEICHNMRDPLINQHFRRMKKRRLQLVVQVGKAHGNKRHCFYVKGIYDWWKAEGKNVRDPLDPSHRLTAEEKQDVMSKIRYLHRSPYNPDGPGKHKRDPMLQLTVEEDGRFWYVTISRKIGRASYHVHELTVPGEVGPRDTGSLDITSATLITHIRELFEKGRLLTSNWIPYTCCTIPVHPIEYWHRSKTDHRIDISKFVAYHQQVTQLAD